jgi:sugar lactone lactonase YvrE
MGDREDAMKNMLGKYSIYIAGIMLACLSIQACEGENPTSPSSVDSYASLESNTVIIDGTSPIALDHIDDSTYVFSIIEHPLPVEEGDIIIVSDGDGHVRRVTGLEITSERMYIGTADASLTDAVISGFTDIVASIGFGSDQGTIAKSNIELVPGAILTSGGIDISGLVLFEGEIEGQPASITIEEGYIAYDPEITIDLGIRDHSITRFLSVSDATLSYSCAVSADIPAELTTGEEIPIATARRRIVHHMGIVPITVTLEIELMLSYAFSGSYIGDCVAGFFGEYDITLGAEYARGAWAGIRSLEPSLDSDPLSCIDYAEASGLRLRIEPHMKVSLYGERIFLAESNVYLEYAAHTDVPPVWNWTISGGYTGACLSSPDGIGGEMEQYDTQPLLYSTTIMTGPYTTDHYIFERLWGSEGSGAGQFAYPRGAAIDNDGNLFVADSRNSRIQKFSPDSTFILKWGREGTGDGQFVLPSDVAVDGAGYIYVTDTGNHRVQKFAPDTSFVTSWGVRGIGPGEFESPTGIAAGPEGNIYVADTGNHRVQKFSPGGSYISQWGTYGNAPGEFDTPRGIAVDQYGVVYVSGCRNNRVQSFSTDGIYLDSWGIYGSAEGEFDCPIAVAVDESGYVYVVDYGNDRLQKFTSTGEFVTLLGSSGTGDGEFDRPEGVAIGHAGTIFIIDSRNSRIQKFAPIR